MVKLEEIAAASGFSIPMVSRVLNPGPNCKAKIAQATRMKIRETAQRLGYRPNRTAEFLKRGRIPTIGVFLPHYRNSLVTDLVMGLSAAASELGFPLEYAFDTKYENYRKFLEETRGQCNCGLITYPHFMLDAEAERLVNRYLDEGGKMVLVNAEDFMPQVPHVDIDDREGGRIAARALLDAGCEQIIGVNVSIPERFDVFREEAGDRLICEVDEKEEELERVVEICKKNHGKPLGIFVSADRTAVHLHSLLMKAGILPGRDVRLLGYDDLFLTGCLSPALTTISQPFVEVGRQAVRTLVDSIYGKPVQNVKLIPTLVRRETL